MTHHRRRFEPPVPMVSSTRRRRPGVEAIRRDLDAGLITAEQAIERVIEDTIRETVPAHYPDEARRACRALLYRVARAHPGARQLVAREEHAP